MMLPAERHRAIVDVVNSKGSIRVRELSHMFEVTEETVRRDLGNLEHAGKLLRSHGGAMKVDNLVGDEVSYLERESEHVKEKEWIAFQAVQLIVAGDHIALDASTTSWNLALILPDIPMTVVTNSLRIAMEASNRSNIEVVTVGGIVRTSSLSCVGPMVEEALGSFHVNKAFISCQGLHTRYGLSESDALQALVKQRMMEMADEVVVLADHSKVEVRGFKSVGPLTDVDVVITDSMVHDSQVSELEALGIKVIQVSAQ